MAFRIALTGLTRSQIIETRRYQAQRNQIDLGLSNVN